MTIKMLGVIGSGQMGNGIAQVAAMSGLEVMMNDISSELVERGVTTIKKILARNVDKGKMSDAEKDTVLGKIKPSVNLQDMSVADFVVEAATENEAIKFKIFMALKIPSIDPVRCCASMSKPAGWDARRGEVSMNIRKHVPDA